MRQDERAPFVHALEQARVCAFDRGEFVEQESFMRAREIRELAVQGGIAPGVRVLDLCCGIAGPGRFITRELGCAYVGVDLSPSAIAIARARAGDLSCRFEVARIPPLPPGEFDVVLLLETMLAFRDKGALIDAVAGALAPGGRFAFTVEEGEPLTESERRAMPDADTVWPVPRAELLALLEAAGLEVCHHEDHSEAHRAQAQALTRVFGERAPDIAAHIGERALDDLLAAHRLWEEWLGRGRMHKLAFVAERGGG